MAFSLSVRESLNCTEDAVNKQFSHFAVEQGETHAGIPQLDRDEIRELWAMGEFEMIVSRRKDS